jgi:uncharacterized membrane protein YtjA (UPF0391 family)
MSYDTPVGLPTIPGIVEPAHFARIDWCLWFSKRKGALMLHYAVVFFVIALIAAFFGFGGIAVGAAGIAKVLFIVFLIGAIVSFLMSLGRRV